MGACCCCMRSVGQNDNGLGFFNGHYCLPGCHQFGGGMMCAPREEEQDASSVQDVRYIQTTHDGLVTRHDKSGPVLSAESQRSRVATSETEGDVGTTLENSKIAGNKSQLADCKPGSPGKCEQSKISESIVPFADEDDSCPTCLEGKEALWIKALLEEIEVPLHHSIHFHVYNQGAMSIITNSVAHSRTKHIEVHVHFIQKFVNDSTIQLHYCPSEL